MPTELLEPAAGDDVSAQVSSLLDLLRTSARLKDLPAIYDNAIGQTAQLAEIHGGMPWLADLTEALAAGRAASGQLIARIETLTQRIDKLVEEMKFTMLYSKKKQMFHIGFNLEENKLSNSYYDLLASEARQTSYICIARGEIPMTHWFMMGRALTVVDRYKGLISWTGTIFEYLMPLLIMKTYKNTLLDETYSFVIKSQKQYGRQRDLPWGASESGFNLLDVNLDYQYKAIGVPWLGLKRGAGRGHCGCALCNLSGTGRRSGRRNCQPQAFKSRGPRRPLRFL